MANTKRKNTRGIVELYLERDFFNSLIRMLNDYIIADGESSYGKYAAELKNAIMKFSRPFTDGDEDCAAVSLYKNEAAVLIRLFAIYFKVITKNSTDFYSQIGKDEAEINENVEKFFSDLS